MVSALRTSDARITKPPTTFRRATPASGAKPGLPAPYSEASACGRVRTWDYLAPCRAIPDLLHGPGQFPF